MSNLALLQTWNDTTAQTGRDDHRQFNALARRYAQDLQRYAHWLAGDKHTAEDLVQETLLRAWKSLHHLQNPQAAKGWLFTILRRENARRFERKQLQESDIPLETLESNDNYYDTSTEAFVLRRAIEELPAEYREPLVHQVIGGYSQKEIAEKLGLSSAGVGTRLFRARNKLKQALVA
ncbi:sigma-70 family RNA polymerase sigma factor [Sedimenticola hydrogenitrophicus]|uniref:sigma-70 family RNA polymerase sigma factor n=1 Tax=Sedimenticola hydrogenitrophicus TaxID=2967975 RepID=UPI0021A747E5|nr:sigma-70 family RNA polymerase sigma factor [Sedimenticola hydrogenitrophicus]